MLSQTDLLTLDSRTENENKNNKNNNKQSSIECKVTFSTAFVERGSLGFLFWRGGDIYLKVHKSYIVE